MTTREPSRSASVRRGLAAAVALGVLVTGAACTPETSTAGGGGGPGFSPPMVGGPAVDVDTPELRAAKAEAGVEPCVPGSAEPVDGGLPEVELPCFGGGEPVVLSSLEGPLVVNLFASWCGPCREEMPVFADFHAAYGDQVGVLGIDFNDSSADAAMELVADSGVTYPLLADAEPLLTREEGFTVAARGLPVTVVVDEQGEIVFSQAVAFDDLDDLVEVVEDALGPLR